MSASRPTWVEIDLNALCHNLAEVRRAIGPAPEILAVVKADAYGHGVAGVVPALVEAGADQFAVALVEEAVELRRLGVRQPIVVLGSVFPGEEAACLEYHLQPVIYEPDTMRRLDAAAQHAGRPLPCHFKVDTGMGRLGFRAEAVDRALAVFRSCSHLEMRGLMSHLAVADEPEKPLTTEQYAHFAALDARIAAAGFAPRYRHIANSAAILSRELAGCNLVRPGIFLYGGLTGDSLPGHVEQQPVMRFLTRIAQLKEIPAGCGISYGHRFVTDRPSRIAAIPVGYADGYNRLLSNRGEVLVRGQRAPVAGTVCMDWTLVDVTDIPGVEVGDLVTLLGADGPEEITAEEWAEKVGSITYEVFCLVTKRVPRHFIPKP